MIGIKELALYPTAYSGADGNLGILVVVHGGKFAGTSSIKWCGCREEFANNAWEVDRCTLHQGGFLFYHSNKTTDDVAEFINRFETLLEGGRRSPMFRSKVQKCDTNGIIKSPHVERMSWCEPGPFWFKQTMRFSLFTMLLRCANQGYQVNGDFWTALYNSYNLAMHCKASIARFLDGYTWYRGKNNGLANGWYDTFFGLEQKQHPNDGWKILIRPKSKAAEVVEELIDLGNGLPVLPD